MIWMLDTNILVYLTNRKRGYERIARRMSGRSPGEVRLSAITLAELRFGIEKGDSGRRTRWRSMVCSNFSRPTTFRPPRRRTSEK